MLDYAPICRQDRVLVTGAHGMLGRRVVQALQRGAAKDVLAPSRRDLDLCDARAVSDYFANQRPSVVLMLAARVGGIQANIAAPYEFLRENLLLNTHTFQACVEVGVRKALFVGSSCIYPRECAQPMREDYLLTGPVEPTNEGYALAKIAGIRMGQYLAREGRMAVVNLMPPNLYGEGDTFELERSHVVSSLVRRFVDACREGRAAVTLLGTGAARREFLHVDDAARALLWADRRVRDADIVNVGSGQDISIKELAELVAELTGFTGEILWDRSKPDGMPRKLMDSSRAARLGFEATVTLREGVERLVNHYRMEVT